MLKCFEAIIIQCPASNQIWVHPISLKCLVSLRLELACRLDFVSNGWTWFKIKDNMHGPVNDSVIKYNDRAEL